MLLGAQLALSAAAALEEGRERLLAAAPRPAEAAFLRARRWPLIARRAEAGLALARALQGHPLPAPPVPADLEAFAPAALLDAALGRGDLDGAAAAAALLHRAGHPLGPLYAAAVALERGDAQGAQGLAASSPMPLSSRALGRRLEETLALATEGPMVIVRDRQGVLVGTRDVEGRLTLVDGLDPLLVPPLWESASPRQRSLPRAGVPFWLPPETPSPEQGGLRLTLDLDLARVALSALGRRRGTIVLVEPETGAVLAAVSDAHTVATEGAAAFAQRREPASIAKVLTAAAAYRSGIDADAAISHMRCRGVERFSGQPLWCSWAAGPLAGLDHALAISCNTSFARIGVQVGRDRMLEEFRRWGFDRKEGALFGAGGRVHTLPRNARQLADLSVGLTVSDITPLHAALLAAVLANGGTMPEPRFAAGPCGPLGLTDVPEAFPRGQPVVSPRVVPPLRRAMRAVALYGTGTGLAPADFPIALKTGTAAEPRRGYHVNYIGLAPNPRASVAFCVRVTHRPNSSAVTQAAREVTSALLVGLADRRLVLDRMARRQRRLATGQPEPVVPRGGP